MQEDLFVGEIYSICLVFFNTPLLNNTCSNKKVTYVVRKEKNQSNIE